MGIHLFSFTPLETLSSAVLWRIWVLLLLLLLRNIFLRICRSFIYPVMFLYTIIYFLFYM